MKLNEIVDDSEVMADRLDVQKNKPASTKKLIKRLKDHDKKTDPKNAKGVYLQ